MPLGRRAGLLWGIGALASALWACETTRNPGGIQRDITAPVITLSNTAGDTQDIAAGLRFTINAADNLALKTIRLTFSGGFISGPTDTNFTGQVKTVTIGKSIQFPANSGAGGVLLNRALLGNRPCAMRVLTSVVLGRRESIPDA